MQPHIHPLYLRKPQNLVGDRLGQPLNEGKLRCLDEGFGAIDYRPIVQGIPQVIGLPGRRQIHFNPQIDNKPLPQDLLFWQKAYVAVATNV